MGEYGPEDEGDNIEFTAVDIDTYTIWLSLEGIDTATKKHVVANPKTARKVSIRCDKNTDLIKMNNITFTNPVTIVADKEHVERRNVPLVSRIDLRTSSANTAIKIRWF